RVALIDAQLIGQPQLFEQPQDALGARGLQMVDDQGHRSSSRMAQAPRPARKSSGPAAAGPIARVNSVTGRDLSDKADGVRRPNSESACICAAFAYGWLHCLGAIAHA